MWSASIWDVSRLIFEAKVVEAQIASKKKTKNTVYLETGSLLWPQLLRVLS
jgi:hypothetical protein